MSTETKHYYVMKAGSLYLEDVWEEWEDDINYSFTEKLSKAMKFYEYNLTSEWGAPKYLWNNVAEKNIKTLEEMCEFFNGEMIKVAMKTIWKEV